MILYFLKLKTIPLFFKILSQTVITYLTLKQPEVLHKVAFLDRDGVINRDSAAYIKSREEFEFLPGSIPALVRLCEAGYDVIIITNQSAVNRGMITLKSLDDMHRMMKKTIQRHGGRIRDIYYCPHRPDEGCDCRKPKPGLIFKACDQYKIDLNHSIMVGDSAKDIECARNAGCAKAVLVKTGNGPKSEKELKDRGTAVDFVAENLHDAVEWIVRKDI